MFDPHRPYQNPVQSVALPPENPRLGAGTSVWSHFSSVVNGECRVCLSPRHRQFLLRHILVDLGKASPVFDTKSPGVNEQLLQTLLAELAIQ